MTHQTPVEDPRELGEESEDGWFEDELDEAPRRPRRKLLSPVPVTLFVILVGALGFLGGVEVEKNHTSSSSSGGLPSGLAALRSRFAGAARAGSTASSGSGASASGFPGAGGGGGFAGLAGAGVTTGEVSYVSGDTLYVTSGENTVKVEAPSGTTVTKTVSSSVHGVHPGDTVVVRGSQGKTGSVTASSISVSSSGGSSTGTAGSAGSGISTQSLFGAG